VHYYSLLNSLQYKRRCSLLEPVIGLVQAQKMFFEMGNESLSRKDFDDFVANITASVQRYVIHSDDLLILLFSLRFLAPALNYKMLKKSLIDFDYEKKKLTSLEFS